MSKKLSDHLLAAPAHTQCFAQIAAEAWKAGAWDTAADVVMTVSGKDMIHRWDSDSDTDTTFLKSLRDMLGQTGFVSIMKIGRQRAKDISKPRMSNKFPRNTAPVTGHLSFNLETLE